MDRDRFLPCNTHSTTQFKKKILTQRRKPRNGLFFRPTRNFPSPAYPFWGSLQVGNGHSHSRVFFFSITHFLSFGWNIIATALQGRKQLPPRDPWIISGNQSTHTTNPRSSTHTKLPRFCHSGTIERPWSFRFWLGGRLLALPD